MLQPNQKENNLGTFRTMWGMLVLAIGLLGFGLFTITKHYEIPEAINYMQVGMVSTVALVSFLTAIYLPKSMIKGQLKENPDLAKKISLRQFQAEEVIQILITPFIIRVSLLFSVAMYGFSLSHLHKTMDFFYGFASFSILCLLLNFPSESRVKSMVEI